MPLVVCTPERHAPAIRAIFNHAIAHSTALFDYHPRSPETIAAWFDAKAAGGFPVLGIEDAAGQLLAFASYGTFRAWPAYHHTVEHSVYVHPEHRGQGLGRQVLTALIDEAQARQVHVMVGAIEAGNTASLALHRELGFETVGLLKEVGYKFGRWLDVAFVQRTLATPEQPTEG